MSGAYRVTAASLYILIPPSATITDLLATASMLSRKDFIDIWSQDLFDLFLTFTLSTYLKV